MDLLFITGNGEIARYVVENGATRLFVDLEVLGKAERQGHLDTVMSGHTWDDVRVVRQAAANASLMVRINPLHSNTQEEIERAIDEGADSVMLPMVDGPECLQTCVRFSSGRIPIIPLVETASGLVRISEIASVEGAEEIYIGLNDMHLELGLTFMFQILAEGLVDHMVDRIQERGKRFGFGGVGRMEGDMLPGWRVLAEHVRLSSSSVILSRSFHMRSQTVAELEQKVDFAGEVALLRDYEMRLKSRSKSQIEVDRAETQSLIREIAAQRREVTAG
ncbi:MAG: hypothetical protein KF812_06550 [Fimbriimonadaceae bacterium]|nr:hypothetical protein [Fimbriimonadaceae bacterium]